MLIAFNKNDMEQEAIKLELIEWLTQLDDQDTLMYLKVVKDLSSDNHDWWEDLTEVQVAGINRGVKDIDEGRVVPHEDVKMKYGI